MAWMYWFYSPAGVAFYALLFALIADKKTFRRLGESENGPFWQLMAGAFTGLLGLFGVVALLQAFIPHPFPSPVQTGYFMVVLALCWKLVVVVNLVEPLGKRVAPSDVASPGGN